MKQLCDKIENDLLWWQHQNLKKMLEEPGEEYNDPDIDKEK